MPETDTPEELDPAAAFDAMGRRLAGLTAAIDVNFSTTAGNIIEDVVMAYLDRHIGKRDFSPGPSGVLRSAIQLAGLGAKA